MWGVTEIVFLLLLITVTKRTELYSRIGGGGGGGNGCWEVYDREKR